MSDLVVLARSGSRSTWTVVSSMLTMGPERISAMIMSISGSQALATRIIQPARVPRETAKARRANCSS